MRWLANLDRGHSYFPHKCLEHVVQSLWHKWRVFLVSVFGSTPNQLTPLKDYMMLMLKRSDRIRHVYLIDIFDFCWFLSQCKLKMCLSVCRSFLGWHWQQVCERETSRQPSTDLTLALPSPSPPHWLAQHLQLRLWTEQLGSGFGLMFGENWTSSLGTLLCELTAACMLDCLQHLSQDVVARTVDQP